MHLDRRGSIPDVVPGTLSEERGTKVLKMLQNPTGGTIKGKQGDDMGAGGKNVDLLFITLSAETG